MKRPFWLATALLAWIVLAGMAPVPGGEVPKPDVEFKATVRDDQDIATKLDNVSWDGEVYFTGTRGRGSVAVPFEKVRKVTAVDGGHQGFKDFQITLKSGDTVAVSFDMGAKLTGTTSFGTYSILAKNIREIIFE